ncbi:MAG: hypothetical protein OXC17_10830 [Aestuariivita sp.]|nr:hypothetical protein [Aestuariivita sp.]
MMQRQGLDFVANHLQRIAKITADRGSVTSDHAVDILLTTIGKNAGKPDQDKTGIDVLG